MNKEEKRIKLAEAFGRPVYRFCGDEEKDHSSYQDPDATKHDFPDYFNDLNAIMYAVASLPEEKRHAYAVILASMLWLPSFTRGWQDWRDTLAISEATAEQRCEALGLALDLWPQL